MKCESCGYKLCGSAEEKKGTCVPCERKEMLAWEWNYIHEGGK